MEEELINFLNKLKYNSQTHLFDEAAIKQTIILPILQSLGWSIFDPAEVHPEFVVENRKVDYCLKINNRNEFFIEVIRIEEDLDTAQDQFLEHAFRQGIKLAALTNGITWHFYLPMKKGDWASRRFYTIDILEQESSVVEKQLNKILSKYQIQTGATIKYAEELYQAKLKPEVILNALPKAWNKIITKPDGLLLKVLSELTEKMSGFKPEEKILIQFIRKYQSKFLFDELSSDNLNPPTSSYSNELPPNRFMTISELMDMNSALVGTKPSRLKINEDQFEVITWTDVDIIFVTWLIDHGVLTKSKLPLYAGKSKQKYFVNDTDQHSSSDFDGSWKMIKDGFWVDVKYNAPHHIKNINMALEQLNVKDKIEVSLLINNLD